MGATVFALILLAAVSVSCATASAEVPNIILIYVDDMGYGDLAVYGHPTQEWGAIDDMARDGLMFTSYYTASPKCSPSRAALLTGRYAFRSGFHSSSTATVLNVKMVKGLPLEETTIAEALRAQGYTTGMVGKWHLGINAATDSDGSWLPDKHGFDYVGLNMPMSLGYDCEQSYPSPMMCHLYDGATIVQQPVNTTSLTQRLVSDVKTFVSSNKAGPFFMYYATVHLHVPLFADKSFTGSARGDYGNNVNELHWAVGEIVAHTKALGIDKDTLIILTSDNGPAITTCLDGGDTGPFYGSKGTFYEGGIRMPMVAYWPDTIEAGSRSNAPITSLDIFPTLVELADGQPHADLDGSSVVDLLTDPSTTADDRPLLFYCNEHLYAARYGSYKFLFGSAEVPSRDWLECLCADGVKAEGGEDCMTDYSELTMYCTALDAGTKPLVFNVDKDPHEYYPLSFEIGDEIADILKVINAFHHDIGERDTSDTIFDITTTCDTVPCCDESEPGCACDYDLGTEYDTTCVD